MPIRFPTEAANDPGMPRDAGADGTPEARNKRAPEARPDEAKPGKDINQAGFVRERDPDRKD